MQAALSMYRFIKTLLFTKGPKYSWKRVSLVLVISSTALSGSGAAGVFFYRYARQMQALHAKAHIQAIIQTGPTYSPFPTSYLAEVLNLSVDQPLNLEHYSLRSAQARLLSTGVIRCAELRKLKPNLLFIDYTPKKPFILLDDCTNTAMDDQGSFFPLAPLYSPKYLPHLYLGNISHTVSKSSGLSLPFPWGEHLGLKYLEQIRFLVCQLGIENIERIDLSCIEATSAGKRELVVLLKRGMILRLTPKNAGKQLTHYSILSKTLLNDGAKPVVIDLRLTDVAFIQSLEDGLYTDLLDMRKP